MWSRGQLKQNAKDAFKRNYWICVAAAFILMLLVSGGNSGVKVNFKLNQTSSDLPWILQENNFGDEVYFNQDQIFSDTSYWQSEGSGNGTSIWDAIEISVFGFAVSLGTILAPFIVVAASFGIVFSIFVSNPLEVGGNYFFITNSVDGTAKLGDLLRVFKGNRYLSVVGIQLWKDVKIVLWTLCFIIPGIIKTYEYYMVPYLLADNPELGSREAFQTSRDMMMGHKFNTFVLELSFIGWEILSGITFGLLGIFYVNPYRLATKAELYLALKGQYNAQHYNPSDEIFQGVQF